MAAPIEIERVPDIDIAACTVCGASNREGPVSSLTIGRHRIELCEPHRRDLAAVVAHEPVAGE